MSTTRNTLAFKLLVGALASVALLSAAGCGFCFRDNQCDVQAGECCQFLRCRERCLVQRKAVLPDADEPQQPVDFAAFLAVLFPPAE